MAAPDAPPSPDLLAPGADWRRARRPLAVLGALVVGLVLGRALGPEPLVAFALAAGLAVAAAMAAGRAAWALVLAAVVAFGGGWLALRTAPPGEPWRSLAAGATPGSTVLIEVEGTLVSTPRTIESPRDPLAPPLRQTRWTVELDVRTLHAGTAVPAAGRLTLRGQGAWSRPDLRVGDAVRVTGVFAPVEAPSNPGEPDRRPREAQEGRVGSLAVGRAGALTPVAGGGSWSAPARRLAESVRSAAEAALLPPGAEPTPSRALLSALVLGAESPPLAELRDAFARLGVVHVLSISGFHLSVMAFFALLALRLPGDLGRLEPLLVAGAILLYLAILPYSAPLWRSALLVLALLLAEGLGRRHDRLAVLAWAAVALLLYRPLDAWSAGFQLSFGLVAALLALGPRAHAAVWGPGLVGLAPAWSRRRPHLWAAWSMAGGAGKRLLTASVLCWAVSTPIVAYHTGLVSPLAVVTGAILTPLISLLLIAAYAAVLVGAALPDLTLPARALDALAEGVLAVVGALDSAPGLWFHLPRLSLAWCAGATLAAAWVCVTWRRPASLTANLPRLAALAGVVLWASAEVAGTARPPRGVAVRIDTLAVGDGTCHLVRSGRDALLWDCGSLWSSRPGRVTIPRALRALGAWRVPTAVVTHANLDHFNALLDAAEPIGLREVLTSRFVLDRAEERPFGPEAYLLDRLRERGVRITEVGAGHRFRLGEAELEFIAPTEADDFPLDNDQGLVAVVRRPGEVVADVLLTADIQDAAIAALRARRPGLRARVMEAPHHGSAREAAVAFVREVGPEVVLQSTGPSRAHDPRWDAVRPGLGSRWLNTAVDGAAWAEIRTDGSVRAGSVRGG